MPLPFHFCISRTDIKYVKLPLQFWCYSCCLHEYPFQFITNVKLTSQKLLQLIWNSICRIYRNWFGNARLSFELVCKEEQGPGAWTDLFTCISRPLMLKINNLHIIFSLELHIELVVGRNKIQIIYTWKFHRLIDLLHPFVHPSDVYAAIGCPIYYYYFMQIFHNWCWMMLLIKREINFHSNEWFWR